MKSFGRGLDDFQNCLLLNRTTAPPMERMVQTIMAMQSLKGFPAPAMTLDAVPPSDPRRYQVSRSLLARMASSIMGRISSMNSVSSAEVLDFFACCDGKEPMKEES